MYVCMHVCVHIYIHICIHIIYIYIGSYCRGPVAIKITSAKSTWDQSSLGFSVTKLQWFDLLPNIEIKRPFPLLVHMIFLAG